MSTEKSILVQITAISETVIVAFTKKSSAERVFFI
jgi:hypothetical protein